MDLDGGTHTIEITSGTLTGTGFSSPTYYVNGIASQTVASGSWQHIAITTATAFDPNNVDFGRISTTYMDGLLDEIKFYTYELTANQVLMDYQGGAVRIGPGEGLP